MTARSQSGDYTVGWICALPLELAAGKALLDVVHDAPALDLEDSNAYVFGAMGDHKVVMACLANYGLADAAAVASNMTRSFPSLQLRFMVGIGGGVPGEVDVRLGDVVVGTQVKQWDLGKTVVGGRFRRTAKSSVPPHNLETAVRALRALHEGSSDHIPSVLDAVRLPPGSSYPGAEKDLLFPASYDHDDERLSCEHCDHSRLVLRQPRSSREPLVHYGAIGSANQVMKDGQTRDKLASEMDVICFEMEAAGLMNHFPCLVVRGISDYADSHKMKEWQRYAAATASAYVKELICMAPPRLVKKQRGPDIDNLASGHQRCMQDLKVSNPRDDKARIEQTKGGLLRNAYTWILHNPQFLEWQNYVDGPSTPAVDPQKRLLWIRGDAGKGKTMLTCGIIDELGKSIENVVGYFFCQAADARFNHAISVIRGLIYQIVTLQPQLLTHLMPKYLQEGKALFESSDSWASLTDILSRMIEDPERREITLMVDALDECLDGLPPLLDFIIASSEKPRIKWIVTSRNSPVIAEPFALLGDHVRLSLELNESSIAQAVRFYIHHRVDELAKIKKYSRELKLIVEEYLHSNAHDTFLWVALVCANLRRYGGVTRQSTMQRLNSFPPHLDSLYQRMLVQIDDDSEDGPVCRRILAMAAVAERPLTVGEVGSLVESPEATIDHSHSEIENLIPYCGSFLVERKGSIYFVHQSARDFLLETSPPTVFLAGLRQTHRTLFARSVQLLMTVLRRNIHGLVGMDPESRNMEPPQPDPLAAAQYSVLYCISHLRTCIEDEPDSELSCTFVEMMEKKFLYWVEALSLLEGLPMAIQGLFELSRHFKATSRAGVLTSSALQFLRYHKVGIEANPLQVYSSALIFTPTDSPIRRLFEREVPLWVKIRPEAELRWPAHTQTIEAVGEEIISLAFGANGQHILAASAFHEVTVYSSTTGARLSGFRSNSTYPLAWAAFTRDGSIVALAHDDALEVWNTEERRCISSIETRYKGVEVDPMFVAISPDGRQLAVRVKSSPNPSFSQLFQSYPSILVRDAATGTGLSILHGHTESITAIAYASDSVIISGSADGLCKTWHTGDGTCLRTFRGHEKPVLSIASDGQGRQFGSMSADGTVRVWDATTGSCSWSFKTGPGVRAGPNPLVFSPGAPQLAVIRSDKGIDIWDTKSKAIIQTFASHSVIHQLAIAADGRHLAIGLDDHIIQHWGPPLLENIASQNRQDRDAVAEFLAFAPRGRRWVACDERSNLIVRDTATGSHLGNAIPRRGVFVVAPNEKWLAQYQGSSARLEIWSLETGKLDRSLIVGRADKHSLVWSPDSQHIAVAVYNRVNNGPDIGIYLASPWQASGGRRLNSDDSSETDSMVFSRDGQHLATRSRGTIKVWDIESGNCLYTFKCRALFEQAGLAFSPDGQSLALLERFGNVQAWTMNGSDMELVPGATVENWYQMYLGSKYGLDGAAGASWVTVSGRRLIWLPPEFRPGQIGASPTSCISGDSKTIAICSKTFLVYQIRFTD